MDTHAEGSRREGAAGGVPNSRAGGEEPQRKGKGAKGKGKPTATTTDAMTRNPPRPSSPRATSSTTPRTASPAQEEAPYLTHLSLHRGLRTLVAPDNSGRQRHAKKAGPEVLKKPRAAEIAPEAIKVAVLNAGRDVTSSPRRRPAAVVRASPSSSRVRTAEVASGMSRGNSSESMATGSSRGVSPAPLEASTSRQFLNSLQGTPPFRTCLGILWRANYWVSSLCRTRRRVPRRSSRLPTLLPSKCPSRQHPSYPLHSTPGLLRTTPDPFANNSRRTGCSSPSLFRSTVRIVRPSVGSRPRCRSLSRPARSSGPRTPTTTHLSHACFRANSVASLFKWDRNF